MSRRALALFVAAASVATALVLPVRPVSAVAADRPDTSAWVTNGNVHAVVHSGGRTYLGGSFDQVGPNTGFGVPLDPSSGALALASKVNGRIHAAVPDGSGGWFIAGEFTRAAGVSRHYAANIKADGTAGGWNPRPDLPVYALAYDGADTVYLGGEFTTVRRSSGDGGGHASAAGLAATKRSDGGIDVGAVLPTITPGLDAGGNRRAVKALALAPDRGRLYVGGTFTALGGLARSGLAAVDLGAGPAVDAVWKPQPDAPVAALSASSGGRVFVGGAFATIGGGARTGLAVLSASGAGTLDGAWGVTADGPVSALLATADGSRLYVGGSFATIGGAGREGLALLYPAGAGSVEGGFRADTDGDTTSAVLALALSPDGSRLYAGGSFHTIGGHDRRFLAALDSTTGAVDTGFDARVAATVRAVSTSPTNVYAGGEFSSVGGVVRKNVAALRSDGTLDLGFKADTDREVNVLLASGNSLYIGGAYRNIFPFENGSHRGLAKVDAATGAVDTNFVVKIDASVMSLALSGTHLFVGGNFSSVKDGSGVDHPRSRGASVHAATGAVQQWNPAPVRDNGDPAAIRSMAMAPDHSKVYVGGDFDRVGGKARSRLAAVDVITGAPTSWSPPLPANVRPLAPSPDGSLVFVALGGRFGVGNRVQAWRTTGDQMQWDVVGDGDFQAVAATGSLLYVGGHFNLLTRPGGTKWEYSRQHLTALDPATGAIQPWGPSIGGVLGVLDMFVTDSYVYVAGEFDNIGNEPIQGIARFANLGDTPPVTVPPTSPPTSPPATQPPGGGGPNPGTGTAGARSGYWMVGTDGAVYGFGDAAHFGGAHPAAGSSAVDLEPTPSGRGYWIVTDRGVVSTHGDAAHYGAPGPAGVGRGEVVTSLSATPTGRGYWLFTNRGRVLNYGDAAFYGDMSKVALNGPVLDSIPTTSGNGYYMVASDGGIFAFGDAAFRGSMGGHKLNAAVQSLVPDGDGDGYWLVASDGGIFAFEAGFKGSMGGTKLNRPVTGMVRFADGYLMVGEDGGIFNFSSRPFLGSLGGNPPAQPIVSVAALG